MELVHLRTFEAVVRHRTVTEAAVAVGLAPSSVSQWRADRERLPGLRDVLYAAAASAAPGVPRLPGPG